MNIQFGTKKNTGKIALKNETVAVDNEIKTACVLDKKMKIKLLRMESITIVKYDCGKTLNALPPSKKPPNKNVPNISRWRFWNALFWNALFWNAH